MSASLTTPIPTHESSTKDHKTLKLYAIFVWFLGAFFFFSEYALRVSPGVMYPDLIDKYSVSAAALGMLSSMFYYPYIIMQIPVGIITDKFGPRKVMVLASFLTGLACLIFLFANSFNLAIISRAIMGFCAAFAFVGTLRIAINWFSPTQFSMLAGLTQAAGMLGASFGSAPLGFYLSHVGISGVMLSFAALFLLLALLMGVLLKKLPRQPVTLPLSSQQDSPFKRIFTNKQLWINCFYISMLYGPTVVLAESWGISFTEAFRSLSEKDASMLVSLIFIGLLIGCPIMGVAARVVTQRFLMRICAVFCLIFALLIIYKNNLSLITLCACYFLYGLFNSGIIAAYARSASLVTKEVSGLALSITNIFSILLGAIFVQIVGAYLSAQNTTDNAIFDVGAYQHIFTLLIVSFAICIFLALLMSKNTISRRPASV
ncbi:MFS transporter [Fangia hongkongensis]|uniref:MFS transporter n=1 Tax=Fangia hongkongensis TaxID=270495 RepID=UPI00037D6D7C|nr:MFS transporter [Fangia hongkongensis]MBK2123681.1 MFS transporter [Fangia hongkongensis]